MRIRLSMECSASSAAGGDGRGSRDGLGTSATAGRLGGRVHLHQQARSSRRFHRSARCGDQPGGETVDDLPHLVEVAQLGRPEPGDSMVRFAVGHLDQAFPLQDPERLPQRRALTPSFSASSVCRRRLPGGSSWSRISWRRCEMTSSTSLPAADGSQVDLTVTVVTRGHPRPPGIALDQKLPTDVGDLGQDLEGIPVWHPRNDDDLVDAVLLGPLEELGEVVGARIETFVWIRRRLAGRGRPSHTRRRAGQRVLDVRRVGASSCFHPSPSVAARRSAAGVWPPMMTGGRGLWMGFGSCTASGERDELAVVRWRPRPSTAWSSPGLVVAAGTPAFERNAAGVELLRRPAEPQPGGPGRRGRRSRPSLRRPHRPRRRARLVAGGVRRCGVPFERRGARCDDLHPGDDHAVDGRGRHLRRRVFVSFTGAVQAAESPSRVPVRRSSIGGQTPAALRRAATLGDGWSSWMLPPDDIEDTLARLDAECEKAGRDPASLRRIHTTFYPGADDFTQFLERSRRTASTRSSSFRGCQTGIPSRSWPRSPNIGGQALIERDARGSGVSPL